jgi:hypothetical protein
MGLLYGRAGRLTAENGGFRPGQFADFDFGPDPRSPPGPAQTPGERRRQVWEKKLKQKKRHG